jgi:hypothetical protein
MSKKDNSHIEIFPLLLTQPKGRTKYINRRNKKIVPEKFSGIWALTSQGLVIHRISGLKLTPTPSKEIF